MGVFVTLLLIKVIFGASNHYTLVWRRWCSQIFCKTIRGLKIHHYQNYILGSGLNGKMFSSQLMSPLCILWLDALNVISVFISPTADGWMYSSLLVFFFSHTNCSQLYGITISPENVELKCCACDLLPRCLIGQWLCRQRLHTKVPYKTDFRKFWW